MSLTSEVLGIKVVALVLGGEVRLDPQGPRQGEEPRAAGAEGQAGRVRREGDAGSVVRQVLELLLLWPQGRGREEEQRETTLYKEGKNWKSAIRSN